MELDALLSALRGHRLIVAAIVLVSFAAAVLIPFRVNGLSKPIPRHGARGQADQQVLIDSPLLAVAETHQDIESLWTRAPFYAQVMGTKALLQRTAQLAHIPYNKLTSEGPWTGVAAGQNVDVPAEARGMQIAGERAPYRLSFVPRVHLPIVTIHAEAPNRWDAAALVRAASQAIVDWNRARYDELVVKPKRPIIVRPIDDVQTTEFGGRTAQIQALLIGATGTIGGLLALVAIVEMRRRLRPHPMNRLPEMTA
ncbi:MAG TPA: hypothetical protein VI318_03855 [Baekduia sp.]